MRLRGIDHIQLAMPRGREDEARSFYEGILGIPEVQKPANLAKRGGCWFDRDALKIHLGVEDDFRPAHKAHPAFLVEDLPGLRRLLEAASFSPKLDEPLEGYNRFYIDDPFAAGLHANGCSHVETGLIRGAVHYVVEDQPAQVADLETCIAAAAMKRQYSSQSSNPWMAAIGPRQATARHRSFDLFIASDSFDCPSFCALVGSSAIRKEFAGFARLVPTSPLVFTGASARSNL